MNKVVTDILIAGGGPAGISAALAASESGSKITVVDDNPRLGGQIWRSDLAKKSTEAAILIQKIEIGRVEIINRAQIFDAPAANALVAETPDGRIDIEYKKLIIATGGRERFLPFPGWTLPQVFGAGGLQALVKGGMNIEDNRIVVAGTGPLLLAVAEYLKSKGAIVIAIAEQTSRQKLLKFSLSLLKSPSKIIQGISLRSKLLGIPYLPDSWITQCRSPHVSKGVTRNAISVTLTHKNGTKNLDCDYVACGFHLLPNIELPTLLGCHIENGFVAVDEFQRTSCENIFCAGEPTGIGGLEASLVEGKIAGYAASGNETKAKKHFRQRQKALHFGSLLNRAFDLRDELRDLPDADTIVCRCEDVSYGRLATYNSGRQAKLQTRCGMGACQGRVCGAATEFLFGWQRDRTRPPIFPVRIENL